MLPKWQLGPRPQSQIVTARRRGRGLNVASRASGISDTGAEREERKARLNPFGGVEFPAPA